MSSPSGSRKRRHDDMDIDQGAEAIPWVSFRLLCPVHRSGHIIGKGGDIIKKIREETGARIKLDDAVPGDMERIVNIKSADDPDAELCAAQEAVLQVVSRMFDQESVDQEIQVRLLIDHSQTGGVIGKDGKIINELREQSKSNIKIFSNSGKPNCAQPFEDLVQVTASYEDALKGVTLVSQRLRVTLVKQNRSHPPPTRGPMRGPPPPGPPPGRRIESYVENPSLSTDGYVGPVQTEFRLLVPDANIGCVIGKGGKVVKAIRDDTGARVHVHNLEPSSSERVVECTSVEEADSRFVAAIEAVLQVYHCLFNEDNGLREPVVRMLLPSSQVGAVLGKAGNTIKQMRQETGTHMVVHGRDGKDDNPSVKSGDEVLQIEGSASACISALKIVTVLLRGNMIRSQANVMEPQGRPFKQPHYEGGQLPPHMAPPLSLPPPPGYMDMNLPGPPSAHNLSNSLQKLVKLIINDGQVGVLLGKGGSNIQSIRKASGARVKIHDEKTSDGNREVEITGTMAQTQEAENLISQVLASGTLMLPY